MRYIKCKGVKKDWSVITLGCWQIAPSEGWGNICSPQSADTVVKTALAWVLEQKNILTAIVGSRKPDQVSEFALAGDLRLSAEHLNQLNNASISFHRK